jgi:hypothetical protein
MHASHDDSQPEPAAVRPATRRLGRVLPRSWALRGLILLALLLVVVAVVTQVVLSTNIPRDLVLSQLQRQLGLRVEAASLSTSWLGNTRLRDVTIALPLSDESLVRVPSMRVKHNSLLGLAWSRAVTIDLVELTAPHLVVRQDAAGRWNIQEVADLLARTGGKQPAAEQARTRSSRPKLPAVRVTDAVVEVIDRAGRRSEIRPVNVTGEPEGALTWRYDVTAGNVAASDASAGAAARPAATAAPGTRPAASPALGLTGRVAVGGSWEHEVAVVARDVQAWAEPLTGGAGNLPAVASTASGAAS